MLSLQMILSHGQSAHAMMCMVEMTMGSLKIKAHTNTQQT